MPIALQAGVMLRFKRVPFEHRRSAFEQLSGDPMLKINQVLFPTDLSDFSKAALPIACALARVWNARLQVLHVMPPILYEEQLEERNHPDAFYAGAEEALAQFVSGQENLEIERRITTGKPAEEIVGAASDLQSDLIVMATHGKSGLARLFLGSVTEKVLRDAPCPVLCFKSPQTAVAASGQGLPAIKTILCPIDFSASAEQILDLACLIAKQQKARLVLLHVACLPDMAYMGYGAPGAPLEMNEFVEDMRKALDRTNAPDPEVPLERRLEDGNPPDVISDVAQEIGADLIVMGTHGYKGITHAVMGSVAEHVVRKASCPVLTFRPHKVKDEK
jgi:nucleotide-binding universal stress UspA family protein